ncbi:MAG: Holliday junction branch migration DNA helicase RuvB [Halobacteriovoraceae bacterium]|nr:Holliday junction branch migration DNA helicase RuvB [Halobacteriovoraceae bacterium]|tara:strand:- start:6099 stop:7082 length:984 start_codon:yes stop_codon:yes gene_type:complete
MEENRLVSEGAHNRDIEHESRLRPKDFSEYIGQKRVVENIELMVKSANKRNAAMDHVLLSGPPGLGKTSLAMIIAQELGSELHVVSGPAIEKKGDLAAVLTNLQPKDVLFIDEIHRMHISVEEILYSAMEDFRLDILIGQGASARTMQIDLVPFTLIGATTRSGLLSNPLRDRFMAHLHFEYYSAEDLSIILNNNSHKLHVKLEDKAKLEIASRSRGTPRIANRILRRVRDYALIEEHDQVEFKDVEKAMELLDIDSLGLDSMDRKILTVIKEYYQNGPVGIDALCATLGEDKNTIEEVYEPFLLQEGLLLRTPRGRVLSEKAINHI